MLLIGSFVVRDVVAQSQTGTQLLLPTGGEYGVLWQRLRNYSERRDWDSVLEGLSRYIELVQRPEVNTVVPSGGGFAMGVRKLYSQLVRRLPALQQKSYRERLDSVVGPLWKDARENLPPGDVRRLRHRLVRDYPESSLQRSLLRDVVDDAFERGDWERARDACEHLLGFLRDDLQDDEPDRTESGSDENESLGRSGQLVDRVRARLVLAQIFAAWGDRDQLQVQITALESVRSSDRFSKLAEPLRTQIARTMEAAPLVLESHLVRRKAIPSNSLRPQVIRIARGSDGEPAPPFQLGRTLWQKAVPGGLLRAMVDELRRDTDAGDIPLPYHADADDQLILFQHSDRVVAFDVERGVETWSAELEPDTLALSGLRVPILGPRTCYVVSRGAILALDRASGRPQWKTSFAYDRESGRLVSRASVDVADGSALRPSTEAGAQEAETAETPRGEEGVGANDENEQTGQKSKSGDGDEDEDALCLPSPPAFFQDGLLVSLTVRVSDESLVYLVSLDSEGRETWSTFLGSTGSVNYLGLGSINSMPLAHGDSVYVLTNQGFLAAVDGEDGTIQWVFEYPTLSSRAQAESIRTSNRWQANPIARVGSTLLIAPSDSSQLVAVDRRTGSEMWRHRRERNSTLVGVTDEACIVAGRSASAIGHSGPRRGTVLWRYEPEGNDFVPLGRPTLARSGLVLPGRHNMVVLSPRDGTVRTRTLWDFGGGGNVLVARRFLAVCTPESLMVYGDRQDDQERIGRLKGTSPGTLLTRAKYYLRRYELERGLAELDRWSNSAPPPPSPNSELDSLHLDLAELIHYHSRSPTGASRASRLLHHRFLLERTPERKVKAAVELAKNLEEENRPAEAMSIYHAALVHGRSRTEIVPEEFRTEAIARAGILSIDSEAYLRDRIQQLRRHTDQPQLVFEAIETEADEALKQAHQRSTTLAYQQIIRLYPYTLAAAQAYLDLSLSYRDRLSYAQAIEAMEGYVRDYEDDPHFDSRELIRAQLVLINLLSHVGKRLEAKERALRLIASYGDRVVTGIPGMPRGETVRDYLEPRLAEPAFVILPEEQPKILSSPLRMSWRSPADLEAIDRRFLVPEGPSPPELEDCFLTQSADFVECREAPTGLPRWRLSLNLIPGFRTERSTYFTRPPRSGPKALRGRFEDGRLVLYDQHNLFAVDAIKGAIRWHIPFGENRPASDKIGRIRPPRLRERLRRVLISSSGIHAVSSEKKLYHFNLEGRKLWEEPLTYTPTALRRPTLAHNKLFVHSSQPPGISVHDALTGEFLRRIGNQSVFLDPIHLADDKLLLPYPNRIELLDLATERVDWHFVPPRGTIENLFYFEDHPGECVVVYNRRNNSPALVGLSLQSGRQRWLHEKEFAARWSRFTVFREGSRFYVIHGDHAWHLVALELRDGATVDKPLIAPAWPGGSQKLGTFYSGASARRLYIGSNIIVFHDPNNSISIYDRSQGTPRPAVADAINRFLTEKGSFASSVVGDKLIILTDGGDCAFEPDPDRPTDDLGSLVHMNLVRAWLNDPSNADRLIDLAQAYFRKGRLKTAIDLVGRALVSEEGLAGQSQTIQLRLRYLLDGLKQEYMERQFKLKNEAPSIHTRRLRTSPTVDGELNDWWDVGSRIRMQTPQNIGTVPSPDGLKHWEGEEDLSAILYTGWDEKYFYFALDVTDDVLYPYDRDAAGWKGDCLIIGLDPTGNMGYQQTGNDQLMTLALTLPKRRNEDKNDDEESAEDEEEEEDKTGKPDGKFAVKRKADNTGAIYEVALPWDSFADETTANRPPYRGYSFGLSLLLTDDDTGQGASKTLSINPCQLLPNSHKSRLVWRFIVPNFFPRVKLE